MNGFAIYKLPNAKKAVTIEGKVEKIRYLKEIKEQQGYLIAPFDTNRHEILLIKSDVVTIQPLNTNLSITNTDKEYSIISKSMYEPTFNIFHEAVTNGSFHKLVLSRYIELCVGLRDPKQIFHIACACYPNQMVTLFCTEKSGMWIIATPEILLTSTAKGMYKTMALAGTKSAYCHNKWSKKNCQEQKIVSDYVKYAIAPFAGSMKITEPYSTLAGGVQHLRTDFEFTCKKEVNIGEILSALHPTPAICGLPKDEALEFIYKYEGYDREYYSGFSGPLKIEESSDLFVTLRCAKIEGQHATFYAGGGILNESKLVSEEYETYMKIETMKKVFNVTQ